MDEKQINYDLIAKLANELFANHEKENEFKNMVLSITIGSMTYDVWKSKNEGKYSVIKSVLPNAKTAEKDYHKELDKEQIVAEIEKTIRRAFDDKNK